MHLILDVQLPYTEMEDDEQIWIDRNNGELNFNMIMLILV